MLAIRGTKNVLDRLGGVTATDGDRSTTRLGDWYVTPPEISRLRSPVDDEPATAIELTSRRNSNLTIDESPIPRHRESQRPQASEHHGR